MYGQYKAAVFDRLKHCYPLLNIGVVLFWHGFNKSIGTGKMTDVFYFFVSSIFIAPTQIFFNCTRK